MPRPLILLIAFSLFSVNLYAETDGEVYEEVDKIFTEATEEVGENLAKFVEANERPLGKARAELAELIARLNKEGKSQLATSIQKRVNTLDETVQKRASAKVPIVEPPKKPLLERLEGKWVVEGSGAHYRYEKSGRAICVRTVDGKVLATGTLRATSPEVAVNTWQSGNTEELHMVGDDIVALLGNAPSGKRSTHVLERAK